MRRVVPLLTAVVTAIAVGALPFASASASPLTGTRTTGHAILSHSRFVTIGLPSSPQNGENQHPKKQNEPEDQRLCLTNASTYCASINPADHIQAIIDNFDLIRAIIDWITYKINSQGHPEVTPQTEDDQGRDNVDTDENNGGEQAGLCLQSTGGDIAYANCNGSGTVWFFVTHNSGIYIVNRYLYNHGSTKVLTVRDTVNGFRLYVASEGTSGTWQTWTWTAYCDNCIP